MENFRSNRPLIIGVGVLAVVLLLGLVVWLVAGRDSSDQSVSEPASVSANDTSEDFGVVAGAGGSRVAADGVTGLGYENSCKGAVEAATSYASILNSRDLHSEEKIAKTVEAISADESFAKEQKEYTSMAVLTQGMSKEELNSITESRDTFHPNWSGKYLVRDCEPGKSATVSVTGVLESVNTVQKQTEKNYEYMTATYELVWQDNDWKAQRYVEAPADVREPLLTDGIPDPTQADTAITTWNKDHFETNVQQQERIVMDSAAFEQAFQDVEPDITQWYNFSEAN